jgi:hypothetical protein
MSSEKRLLTVKFCAVNAAPGSSVLIFRVRNEKADDLLKAMKVAAGIGFNPRGRQTGQIRRH